MPSIAVLAALLVSMSVVTDVARDGTPDSAQQHARVAVTSNASQVEPCRSDEARSQCADRQFWQIACRSSKDMNPSARARCEERLAAD